jgi:DNA-binding transcriptional LysR family regulator
MELRHLRYFVTVAEELHFSRAAQRLQMTQQPLSKQIRDLEEELGVQLFHRTKRQVRITEAGEAFLEEARQLLAKADRAVEVARQAARGHSGRLAIGICGLATYSVLPKVLKAVRERSPHVALELHEMTTSSQVQALQNRQIHLGFLMLPIQEENLNIKPILQEPFVVVLPETHPLATQMEVLLPALANEPFILVPRQEEPGYYDRCISLFEQSGFAPRVSQQASEKQTILSLVAAGMGIALSPASVRVLHREGVIYKALAESKREVELALAWRRDESSPVLQMFLEVVNKIVRQ